jgi:hypothetical protein
MKRMLLLTLPCLALAMTAGALDFDTVPLPNFPPVTGFGIAGDNLPDGRLVVWDGGTVFVQAFPRADVWTRVAGGYEGDPGFLAVSPDGHTVLLGAGFATAAYLLDLDNPADYVPGTELTVPTHFSGVFLTESLVAIDRGDFGQPAEVVIVDISSAKAAGTAQTVLTLPSAHAKQQLIEKPDGSYSATLSTDPTGQYLYVMDGNTRELRRFDVSALIAAYNASGLVPWTNGDEVGTAGQFHTGGVAGTTLDGLLVIGGADGFFGPGGVQVVDPATPATVVNTLDPAGTQPFYSVIVNEVSGDVVALANGDAWALYPRREADEFPYAPGCALPAAGAIRGFGPGGGQAPWLAVQALALAAAVLLTARRFAARANG